MDDDDVWKVILLKKSKMREWEETLAKVVPVITANGVISAEDYNNHGNKMDS